MQLYDYQKKVIQCCKENQSHSQLISMPTGTGKTITFLCLAKELNKKTLIIVHREELLNQTKDKAILCGFREEEISVICAEKKEKLKNLNIAMVQSLNRNLDKYDSNDIEVIIIDEAHHATADSYVNILKYFKVFEDKKLLFGFTATPLRGDREHLANIFHAHSFKMTLSEATRLGYIVPVHGLRIEMTKKLSEIENKQGDYDISQLEKVMNCESVNKIVVDRCKNLKKNPAIIFTTSVDHAQEIARLLRLEKRKAISVSYKTSKRTLACIMNMLKQGRVDFITNAVKLSEGFDHPAIQSVILARPTRSPVLYKQMIGRGLRNYKDKFDCYVLEFTSNDEKMIRWEDIDENSTFQSATENQKRTQEEAKKHYRSIFRNSNVEVMDVRLSHFEFYECKLKRHIKHKDFYFTPFTEGFALYQLKLSKDRVDKIYGNFYRLYASVFFWKDVYQSFYAWGEYNYDMTVRSVAQPIPAILKAIEGYANINKFCKWYPSDLEPVTRKQKILMSKLGMNCKSIKSARKAEMEIEEKIIKNCIDKYMAIGLFSGVMEI